MNKVDLTEKRYGKLVCLKQLDQGKILVKCDCGNEKIISRSDFKKTLTCGCSKIKYQVIGKKFGKLKCIKFIPSKKRYECKCSCGNIKYNNGKDLFENKIKSCGCLKEKNRGKARKNWIGKKIGKYTITKFLGMRPKTNNPKKFNSFYEVICECGAVREKNINNLGDMQSCGCLRKSPEYLKKMMRNFKRTADVKTIRSLGKSYTIKQLCEMFEMSEQAINRILKNKSYKWIEEDE
jgi:hypothetical protein